MKHSQTKNKIILLVQITAKIKEKNRLFVGSQFEEPLSLLYLASSLKKKNYAVDIFSGAITKNKIIKYIRANKPFAIGFCVYTATFNASLTLSNIAKNTSRELGYNIFSIFGGYHASALPNDVISHPEVDAVIVGEGDITICEVIDSLNYSHCLSKVKGIYFKEKNKIIKTPPRERIKDLDCLPTIERHPNFIKQSRSEVSNLSYPPPSMPGHTSRIVYSRGCPFACSFCSSKNTWGKKIFWRDQKLVVDEIEMLHKKHKVTSVGFLDLTFNANKEKTIKLCKELIKRDLPVYFGAMVRLDLFDEETIDYLARAKCTKFNIGIECVNDGLSSQLKDEYSVKKNLIRKTLESTTKFGILVRAFIIIGFPNETEKMIKSYSPRLNSFALDELRITIATPFPNTQFWDYSKKNNFLPDNLNWDNFTTEIPIIKHPFLKNKNILELRKFLLEKFYFNPCYIKNVYEKTKRHPKLKQSFIDFFELIIKTNLFPKKKDDLTNFIKHLSTL